MLNIDVLPEWFVICFVVLYGLSLGSFVTALSWRLPRGLSIFNYAGNNKRSVCPSCETSLGLRDLVPVFSWLFSKGKCRHCKAPISIRYPLTELGTALLCLVFYWSIPIVQTSLLPLILFMTLAGTLMTIIVIDLEHKIIPNILNLTLALLGITFLILQHFEYQGSSFQLFENIKTALINMVIFCVFSLVLRGAFMLVTKKDPLGLGDVKFFAAVGLWLNINVFPFFLVASGGFGILLGLIWQKITGEKAFPFGPALVLAFVLSLCIPEKIISEFL